MVIPHSPADLSSGWLTLALRRGQAIGAGVVSEFSSGNPEMRQRPNTRISYEREVRFYQNMAKGSLLPIPTCYYADVDAESGWHVILLEDLSPASPVPQGTACSPDQARTAVRHIAQFHAHWWENPILDNLDWMTDASGTPDDELARLHERWWPVFIRAVGDQLPNDVTEIGELLGKERGRIARHLFADRPRTLLHGDYAQGNLMFGDAAERSFFVIDWQFVTRGRGIWDVANFLLRSLEPADRQAIEMDLLQNYVAILDDRGVRDYSLGAAMYDYRISLLRRFGADISTIAAMPFTKKQIRRHVDRSLPRTFSALVDHDCRSLLGGEPRLH